MTDTFTRQWELKHTMTAGSAFDDSPLSPSMSSGGAEGSRDMVVATLSEQLAAERQARRCAEEALRESHAAMIKHQQIGRMGDFRHNTRTRETRGSLEYYKLFGFDPKLGAIDFSAWIEKIHPDDRARIVEALFDAISAHAPILLEYRILLKDETRYIRCESQPDRDHVGDVIYCGMVIDVTERRAAEEALRQAEVSLASALRLASMGELAGSIIHEVSQPLAAIATSADACQRWIMTSPDRKDRALASLERVINESRRAATMLAGLKSLVRDQEPALSPLYLPDAIGEVISLVIAEVARECVLLETDFPADLPYALGDCVQIQQVIMNLIRNAIDAMRTISRRRVLTIGAVALGDEIVLFVADNGVGIAPEHMPKLFVTLYTTKPGGMGLGLAISRKIAAAHGGRIWVEAREGGGATFHLSLPTAPDGAV
jgi:signal transduction histidine kinase